MMSLVYARGRSQDRADLVACGAFAAAGLVVSLGVSLWLTQPRDVETASAQSPLYMDIGTGD